MPHPHIITARELFPGVRAAEAGLRDAYPEWLAEHQRHAPERMVLAAALGVPGASVAVTVGMAFCLPRESGARLAAHQRDGSAHTLPRCWDAPWIIKPLATRRT